MRRPLSGLCTWNALGAILFWLGHSYVDESAARRQMGQRWDPMAYRKDLANSARRHFKAAENLNGSALPGAQPGCQAVAGYLFGLSGELAVKAMMQDSGMSPLSPEQRRDDPFYSHFPDLKSRLLDHAKGRRSGELRAIAEDASLFQNWDTDMRYAPTGDILGRWVAQWRSAAHDLVSRMDAF